MRGVERERLDVARRGGRREQRRPAAGERPQRAVDEPAPVPPLPVRDEAHGLVDRGVVRHAVEAEQRVRRRAQERPQVGVDRLDRPARDPRERRVERAPVPQRPQHQLVQQRDVPRVRERAARSRSRIEA